MKIIFFTIFLSTCIHAQKSSLYKASEKYQPIRHNEEDREITEKGNGSVVGKMRRRYA